MLRARLLLVLFLLSGGTAMADFDAVSAERFARLALDCVEREYPNQIQHVMNGPEDVGTPSELTPVFYGCFDWHSAVHGHWLLVRLCRVFPEGAFVGEARAALDRNLSAERVATELAYLEGKGRATFERPYGLAWLLQLGAELHSWDDPDARRWAGILAPLERVAADRFRAWLPKLLDPIRTGEHSQTAFALGLVWDWCRVSGDEELQRLVEERARFYHRDDRDAPLAYEPSGQDFLSPCLAEADLMRRVLPRGEFADWLSGFLPGLPEEAAADWLPVALVSDRSDGKLAHLDGLNLSRAWMLEGILDGLPTADPRRPALEAAARAHRVAGLAAVTGEHYEGGHWLGSFAVYLVSGAGLAR